MRLIRSITLFAAAASALDSAGWRTQSIYQVVTDRFARTDGSITAACILGNYCGGTFQGLIKKLNYIQGMGFTAIWISPVIANINASTPYGFPYHGYWPQDNYAINPKFGTPADLVALSTALHDRGMYLMVDVVPNHMAFNGAPSTIDYTVFNPFNKPSYFHQPYCTIDYGNTTSEQNCWMGDKVVSLPDLKSEDATVQSMWNHWVTGFVANYSIDGLRVDSAGQMTTNFFPGFVKAGGVYQVGEVVNGNPDTLCDYQKYMPSVLNYAYYFWIVNSFSAGGSLTTLSNNIGWLKSTCADVTIMPTFIENHDQPRWPSFESDGKLIANAIAFTVLSDGIPLIYYGQEQGLTGATDPQNRGPMWPSAYDTTTALYKFISRLNTFRNFAISKDSTYATAAGKTLYSDAKTLVRMKGASGSRVITIWTNDGSDAGSRRLTLSASLTGFGANSAFIDIVSCDVYTTDASGNLVVTIQNGMPLSLYRTSGLKGSGLCSSTTTKTLATENLSSIVTSSNSSEELTSTSLSTFTSSTVKTSTSSSKSTSLVLETTSSSISSSNVLSTKTTSTDTTTNSMPSSASSSLIKSSAISSSVSSSATSTTISAATTSVASSISSTSVKTTISSSFNSFQISTTLSTSRTSTSTSSTPILQSTSTSSSSTSPAQASSTLAILTNNKCGAAVGLTCLGSNVAKGGQCCSRYDSCGATADYCCPQRLTTGGDCQAGYGSCLDATDPICVAAVAGTTVASSSAVPTSSSSKTASTSTKVASCTPAASVVIAFAANVTTTWGQNVYLTGSADELNSWNTSVALTMCSDDYPIWKLNVTMAVGQDFDYKFIKADGSIIVWEADPNRNYTVPTVTACSVSTPVATIGGAWQV